MSDAWRCLLCLHADIPVFPTVTAVITLEKYEESISATNKFLVPRDYHKVSIIYTVKSAVLLVFFDLISTCTSWESILLDTDGQIAHLSFVITPIDNCC